MADIVFIEENHRHERVIQPGEHIPIRRTEGSQATPQIGSGSGGPFFSSSPYISQRHAEMRCSEDGRFWIKDLDSSNGTWLRLTPFQEHELPPNFEVLLAKDVLVQRRTHLWETFPDMRRYASVDDFIAHLRSVLREHISDLQLVSMDSPVAVKVSHLCGRLPLPEQRAYLVVTWKTRTFDLSVERWLQTCVVLFNSSRHAQVQGVGAEDPWQFVAASPQRRHVLQLARRVAPTACTVLLYGESGTGKEVMARDLHDHSDRFKGPFVPINCAAIPADLIEAELFGTARGAFTGATDRPGLFEKANGGTLFLDEIGEMPRPLQAKLLRVLESRRVRRVGDRDSVERPVDVRIIAATNRNLDKMVDEGAFRHDLRFRLDGVPLTLPDIKADDVVALVPPLCARLEQEGFPALPEDELLGLSRLAAQRPWPGNVRELLSALRRYFMFRDPQASVEKNWEFVLQASGSLPASLVRAAAQSDPPSVPSVDVPTRLELPHGLAAVVDLVDNLLFLTMARQVLLPFRWGALERLGEAVGMKGAGASARLKRLEISTDPEPSATQIDAAIAKTRAALKPYQGILQSVLGLSLPS